MILDYEPGDKVTNPQKKETEVKKICKILTKILNNV